MRQNLLVLVFMAVLLACSSANTVFGATNYRVKFDGPLDSVLCVIWEDAIFADSIKWVSFPEDTTLSLDETKAIRLEFGYFYTGYSDGLWASENVNLQSAQGLSAGEVAGLTADSVQINLDSLMKVLGFGAGAKSFIKYNNDADTNFILVGTDTIQYIVYFHPSGTGGGLADSTKAYLGAP